MRKFEIWLWNILLNNVNRQSSLETFQIALAEFEQKFPDQQPTTSDTLSDTSTVESKKRCSDADIRCNPWQTRPKVSNGMLWLGKKVDFIFLVLIEFQPFFQVLFLGMQYGDSNILYFLNLSNPDFPKFQIFKKSFQLGARNNFSKYQEVYHTILLTFTLIRTEESISRLYVLL